MHDFEFTRQFWRSYDCQHDTVFLGVAPLETILFLESFFPATRRRHTFCAGTRTMKSHPHFPRIPPLPNGYTADSESAKAEDNICNGFGGRRARAGSENIGSVEHGIGSRCHVDATHIMSNPNKDSSQYRV